MKLQMRYNSFVVVSRTVQGNKCLSQTKTSSKPCFTPTAKLHNTAGFKCCYFMEICKISIMTRMILIQIYF